MAMTAVLVKALMEIPQLLHSPPEKLAKPLAPLARDVVSDVPVIS
jgi:hypothetical protein